MIQKINYHHGNWLIWEQKEVYRFWFLSLILETIHSSKKHVQEALSLHLKYYIHFKNCINCIDLWWQTFYSPNAEQVCASCTLRTHMLSALMRGSSPVHCAGNCTICVCAQLSHARPHALCAQSRHLCMLAGYVHLPPCTARAITPSALSMHAHAVHKYCCTHARACTGKFRRPARYPELCTCAPEAPETWLCMPTWAHVPSVHHHGYRY